MTVKESMFVELVENVARKLKTKDNFMLEADLDIGVTIAQNRGKFKLNAKTYIYFKDICSSLGITEPNVVQNMWLNILKYSKK